MRPRESLTRGRSRKLKFIHTVALLLFLHDYSKHSLLLSLTCTQKMQKWHRKGRKSSVAISTYHIPLKAYRNVSSTRRPLKSKTGQENNGEKMTAAGNDNSENSWLKRDVEDISGQIMKGLTSQKVQQQFYKTLRKYGTNSGLAMQLLLHSRYD